MLAEKLDLRGLHSVPKKEGEIQFLVSEEPLPLARGMSQADLDMAKELIRANPRLFDAERYFLKSANKQNVVMIKGRYSDFIATREHMKNNKNLDEEQIKEYFRCGLSILGANTVFISQENAIIVQKRSGQVTQAKGYYHLPAGGVMTGNPFEEARKQLRGEQGIVSRNLGYLGVVCGYTYEDNPDFVFLEKSNLKISELEQRFLDVHDQWEADHIRFISAEPDQLLKTFRGEYLDCRDGKKFAGQFLACGLACFAAYGFSQFGSEWFKEAVKVLISGPLEIHLKSDHEF